MKNKKTKKVAIEIPEQPDTMSPERYNSWIEQLAKTMADDIVDGIVLGEIVRRKAAGKKKVE